ncbi:hypothetical protein UIA24_20885 [Pseudomonas sp. AL 58]|uniref:hypothetical protein n=1 Tax=Pseudomonas sp. AL 58 TaxID=3104275 RepID=UPI002EAB6E19|nr:hypothetical protein [Pseudomonas sp. AL 58]
MKASEGLSRVRSLLDNWATPRELPPQLTWKYAHEPELLGWRIKARNYNTVIANGLFFFWLVVAVWFGFSMHSNFETYDEPVRSLCALLFFSLLIITVLSMTHQRMNFAYRFTKSGAEFCKWKVFPEWTLTFLKGLAAFTAIAFMCMASAYNDPALLIGAIGGSGSVMLTHASMNSARYRDLQTDFHHHTYEWSRFTEVAIDRKQKLVGLEFAWYNDYLNKHSRSTFPLFAKRKAFESILGLVEQHLPNVPRADRHVDRG